MPELPEVQSFADALHATYAGGIVASLLLRRDDLRFPFQRVALEEIFAPGARLERAERVGKQLRLRTDRGSARVSLGMSGAFFPADPERPRKHEHVTLRFEGGLCLGYEDARRFGFWTAESAIQASSPLLEAADATDAAALSRVFLEGSAGRSRRSIKDLLMDQRHVAGVGNIYALEVLFRTRIHPATLCAMLRKEQWKALAEALPPLLATAIAHGGSSISTYRRLHGDAGGFQHLHLVYGREGEPCPREACRGNIERIVQGGRSSFLCRRCQKPPRI
jgi:formamidopyrimidine-DNA glycosylase